MNTTGQIEKRTQACVVALFRDRLAYHYLGNWIDRSANANIERAGATAHLRAFIDFRPARVSPDP